MINEGCLYYLSRPRRFGKSLLISTNQTIFEGKKQYFDGTIEQPLFIGSNESVDWKWEVLPISHACFRKQSPDSCIR